MVITGPSGSGKSSLAFDTLYAEGQRQYIESLSTYARQFLHQLERPDVDLIEGLQPTISIDQRAGSHNPRSTVATVTEIYDYLRLLFARLGEPRCYQCGEPIRQQTPEQILDALLELAAGHAGDDPGPAGPRPQRASTRTCSRRSARPGFLRARVDGQVVDVNEPPALVAQKIAQHRGGDRPRGGPRRASARGSPSRSTWPSSTATGWCWPRTRRRRPAAASGTTGCSARSTPARTARSATRNWSRGPSASTVPTGPVRRAKGWASRVAFDPELVLPDAQLSLADGAIAPWKGDTPAAMRKHQNHLRPFLAKAGIRWNTPLEKLCAEAPRATAARRRQAVRRRAGDAGKGIRHDHQRAEAAAAGGLPRRGGLQGVRRRPAAARGPRGPRRRQGDPRSHGPDGRRRPASSSRHWRFADDRSSRSPSRSSARSPPGWNFSTAWGWTISRSTGPADTLSGGELQRVRLAAGLGSGLVGVCYVLDEPSIGLHPRDNQRLIDALRELASRAATPWWWSSTTRRSCAGPIGWSTSGPGRAGTAAASWPRARREQSPPTRTRSPAAIWPACEQIPVPAAPPPRRQDAGDHHRRRDDQQSQERQRAVSAFGAWCA